MLYAHQNGIKILICLPHCENSKCHIKECCYKRNKYEFCRLQTESHSSVGLNLTGDPLIEISLLTKILGFFCGLDLHAGTNVLCIMPVMEMRNKKTSAS